MPDVLSERPGASARFDEITARFGAVKYMNETQARVLRELIAEEDAADILEIGFYQGKSSAYVAAILEDRGRGRLVTIDRRDPNAGRINIAGLLRDSGLAHRVEVIRAHRSFTWELQKLIAQGGGPRFDLCYFDGGHTWDDTGFGFLLVHLLLRPGGLIVFDDMDWTIDRSPSYAKHPERAAGFSAEERGAQTVRLVWDLLAPAFGYTGLREIPKIGWGLARKPH